MPRLQPSMRRHLLNDTRLVHGIFVSDVAFFPLSALHIAFFPVPINIGGHDVSLPDSPRLVQRVVLLERGGAVEGGYFCMIDSVNGVGDAPLPILDRAQTPLLPSFLLFQLSLDNGQLPTRDPLHDPPKRSVDDTLDAFVADDRMSELDLDKLVGAMEGAMVDKTVRLERSGG
jgi:hypothetical protein